MTIEQYFDVICPELASDTNKSSYISIAQLTISSTVFGDNYNYAVALKAAHIGSLATRNSGNSGTVTSVKEGDLSISYGSGSSGNNSDLSQTKYGLMLKSLYQSIQMAVSVTGYNTLPI